MRKQLVLLAIIVLISAVSAFGTDLKVNVPFDFVTGNTTLSAGEYTISTVGNGNALMIRNFENQVNVFSLANYAERMTIPEVTTTWSPVVSSIPEVTGTAFDKVPSTHNTGYSVVLTQYGEKFFLSKVWLGFQGRVIPESKLEHQTKMAGLPAPQTVVLVANAR